jgi:membrane fusion protein, multidrug efflux system
MDDRPAELERPPATEPGDAPATAPHHPFAPARPSRWVGVVFRLFVLVLIGGLIAFVANEWDWWVGSAVLQTTDDAYLHADLTPLAAKVPGYVREIPVRDFQKVKAGDLLVQIDDDDYRAELEQAEANVADAQAAIQTIDQQRLLQAAVIKEAEATIEGTEADVTRYGLEAVRQQTLLAGGLAGTRQLVEQADDNEKRAKATLAHDRAELEQQRQQLKVLDSQDIQARATLGAREAARDLAKINLGYTRIVAPVGGMVGERMVQRGQYLSVGTQVIWLAPLPEIWVVANYKETQMTHVRIGQTARVTVDAFPGVVLRGRVDSWSPASGAQFALLPPDNATGNFTKVVQRIPVKITLEPDPRLGDLLRPGMSAIATIDTRSVPPGAVADSGKGAP